MNFDSRKAEWLGWIEWSGWLKPKGSWVIQVPVILSSQCE